MKTLNATRSTLNLHKRFFPNHFVSGIFRFYRFNRQGDRTIRVNRNMSKKSATMEKYHSPYHQSLAVIFGKLTDPRNGTRQYHELVDIIGLTILGLLGGANTWTEIELYGKSNEDWLKELLPLENGIPSHDTLGRVFSMLDPNEFEICFREWMVSLGLLCEGLQVSMDGKSKGKKPLRMVRAWVNELQLSLAQVKVDDKSNETSAVKQLLDLLTSKTRQL